MKNKKINSIELILLAIMFLGIICSIFESDILDNKLYLTLFIIIPFVLVLMTEFIKIDTEQKEKKEIDSIEEEKKTIDEVIEKTIEKLEEAPKTTKKTKISEDTIQIPINEIKKEIESLNKKLNKTEEDLEKTEILFAKGDLKEIIEKELKQAKNSNKKKKTTKTVEKSKTKNKNSTETVEKTKKIQNK